MIKTWREIIIGDTLVFVKS